ncbi:hypothetical protein BKA82DRAFT_2795790 [Pisolithus tinctorius]|nr:hypothetical protein BKA82DRAFT_2795790 [Pisolithus tinctorius]
MYITTKRVSFAVLLTMLSSVPSLRSSFWAATGDLGFEVERACTHATWYIARHSFRQAGLRTESGTRTFCRPGHLRNTSNGFTDAKLIRHSLNSSATIPGLVLTMVL